MKNIFSSMAVALTIWMGLVAGAANAAVLTLSDWTGSATTGYTATFGNTYIYTGSRTSNLGLADEYNFTLPLDSSGNFIASVYDSAPNAPKTAFSAFYLQEFSVGFDAGGIYGHNSFSVVNGPVPGNYTLHVLAYFPTNNPPPKN
jgi:hypothetical protein